MAEQLLDVMRANHQISQAQYEKLKKKAEAQSAAQRRTEKEYNQLKRQVEEQRASVENQRAVTETQYQELKQQAEQQKQAEQAAIAQQIEAKTSGKNVYTYNQQQETGTGNGGGLAFNMSGISVNIGGFIEAAGLYRTRDENSDIGSTFNGIPLRNNPAYYEDESRFSARQSRLSILVQGSPCPTLHLSGYYEMDFLGDAQTGNSTESNSYNMRIRHLYTTADWDTYGLHLLGGQTWSLATMNAKGIIPRTEDVPLTIDAQYVPGFDWTRQPQFRLVKDWDKTWWLGVSVENPQSTSSTQVNSVPTN